MNLECCIGTLDGARLRASASSGLCVGVFNAREFFVFGSSSGLSFFNSRHKRTVNSFFDVVC